MGSKSVYVSPEDLQGCKNVRHEREHIADTVRVSIGVQRIFECDETNLVGSRV
jgi:hypothetical protein